MIFRTLLGLTSTSLTTLSTLDDDISVCDDDVTGDNDVNVTDLFFQISSNETDSKASFKEGSTRSVPFAGLGPDAPVSNSGTFFRFRFLAIFSNEDAAAEIGTLMISSTSISEMSNSTSTLGFCLQPKFSWPMALPQPWPKVRSI